MFQSALFTGKDALKILAFVFLLDQTVQKGLDTLRVNMSSTMLAAVMLIHISRVHSVVGRC